MGEDKEKGGSCYADGWERNGVHSFYTILSRLQCSFTLFCSKVFNTHLFHLRGWARQLVCQRNCSIKYRDIRINLFNLTISETCPFRIILAAAQ